MSYAHAPLGIWAQIVHVAANVAGASATAGGGVYQKQERTAKNDAAAARFELEAARAGTDATRQSAEIAAGGEVDAARIRLAAQQKARAKQTQMILIGSGIAAALALTGFVLFSGAKESS